MDYNGGTPRFRVGNPAGNQINWDGTNLKVQSLNLTIDQNGVLIAPDATARSEDNGYRFGAGFGSYGTLITTGPPNYQILDIISDYAGFGHTARVNIRASATTDPSTASITLQGVQTGTSSIAMAADAITLTGTLTIGTATYPGTATPSGAYLRADGTNWITSTLILPNAITANQIVFGSATNTYGSSANFVFDGTNVGIGTASPSRPLHVYKNASGADPLAKFQNVHASGYANIQIDRSATNRTSLIHYSTADVVDWQVGTAYNGGSANSAYSIGTTNDLSGAKLTVLTTGLVGIGTTAPTAVLHLKAGAAAASSAPLKFTSGTNLTTAEAGAVEYNGTNLFFTRAGTVRENVLVAIDNVAAPSTTGGFAITNYYGSGATNFLGDPNRWLSVNVLGATYKIPLYT
jgi:hypothetical protein